MSAEQAYSPPPFLTVLQAATGGWQSRSLGVTVRLGIPELLDKGPRTAADLAASTGAVPSHLYRMLRALAREGFFEEGPTGTFGLTAPSRALLPDAPDSVRHMVLWLSSPWMRKLWDGLEAAIVSEKSVFRGLFGADIYPWLRAHPEEAVDFHGAMSELTRIGGGVIGAAHDFSRYDTLVDVGGGTGEQIAAILQQHSHVRGITFDAPELADSARDTLARHGLSARCEVRTGDLRETVPEGAHAYLLKNIVHDMNDQEAIEMLARCRRAMRPGGAVIVVQNVVPELAGPYFQFLDLQLLLSGAGGKERTRAEFDQLFSAAGLHITSAVQTPTLDSLLVGEAWPPPA